MRKTGLALALAGWGALAAAAACGGSFNTIADVDGGDATAGDGGGMGTEGGADAAKDAAGGDGGDATTNPEGGADTGAGPEASAETGAGEAGNGDAGDAGDAAEGGGVDAGCPVSQVCEPPAPTGWQGPIDLVTGANGGAAPPCPSSTDVAFDASAGLDAGAAVCSSCGCSAPSGLGCAFDVRVYQGLTCSNATPCAAGQAGPQCSALSGSCSLAGGLGLNAEAHVVPVAGQCTPTQETATVPPATWSTNVAGCSPNAAQACGAGGACLPTGSRSCVYLASLTSGCPAPYTGGPHIYFQGTLDDRSCTGCTCGGADAACAGGGSVTISTQSSCDSGATIAADGGCDPAGFVGIAAGTAVYAQTDASPTATGGCPADGGQSSGNALPAGPITVCCLP